MFYHHFMKQGFFYDERSFLVVQTMIHSSVISYALVFSRLFTGLNWNCGRAYCTSLFPFSRNPSKGRTFDNTVY